MPNKQNHAFHELDMVVAAYGERGICSQLCWSDGTRDEVPVKAGTVVQHIAEAYGKTPQSIRRHWRQYRAAQEERFGKMAILAISPGVLLMPVKLAVKMVGRDAAIGYVNLAQPVRFLEEKDGTGARSRIEFVNSPNALDTVWTCRTLERHCAAARLFFLEEDQRYTHEKAVMEHANSYLGAWHYPMYLH